MKLKLRKAVFALSENARITTKELSKILRTSQQSASYLVQQLKKKKIIEQTVVIVDPARLGFTNILVGYNFLKFDDESHRAILAELKNCEQTIAIYETSDGVDLLVEYSAQNLSAFNKTHIEIIQKLFDKIEVKFIFPVVVRHLHNKSYLVRSKRIDTVIHGDRDQIKLSTNEKLILKELIRNADATLTKISQKTKLSIKSVVNIKRKLEAQKVIRGYKAIFNQKKLGVIDQFALISLTPSGIKQMNKITSAIGMNKNCVRLTKLIGEYQLLINLESLKETNIIKELRTNFSIKDYKTITLDKIIKRQYIPENF